MLEGQHSVSRDQATRDRWSEFVERDGVDGSGDRQELGGLERGHDATARALIGGAVARAGSGREAQVRCCSRN